MAKVTFNQILEALRGGIGGLVFRQRPDGATIISGAPRYNKRKATQKQKSYRQKFGQRAKYASWLARKHPIYAELASTEEARAAWKSPFNFALSDCLKPPEIHRIERKEGCILVEATDNVRVAKVRVTVLDEAGKVLEWGDAVRGEANWWVYPSQSEGKKIIAEAWDLADNRTRLISE